MAQVKKLSVKTVYGPINLRKLMDAHDKGTPLHVMSVIGIATGTKQGEGDLGAYECLVGTFEAVNPETGEAQKANILFLPDMGLSMWKVAMAASSNGSAASALNVYAVYVAEVPGRRPSAVPYEYRIEPVVPPTEADDPLERLKAHVASQVRALAAPKDAGPDGKTATDAPASARKAAPKK